MHSTAWPAVCQPNYSVLLVCWQTLVEKSLQVLLDVTLYADFVLPLSGIYSLSSRVEYDCR